MFKVKNNKEKLSLLLNKYNLLKIKKPVYFQNKIHLKKHSETSMTLMLIYFNLEIKKKFFKNKKQKNQKHFIILPFSKKILSENLLLQRDWDLQNELTKIHLFYLQICSRSLHYTFSL